MRKNKLKQAVSRLINAMGLPTHIRTAEEAKNFENQLKSKLKSLPNYHTNITDHLSIILRQNCLLDKSLSDLTSEIELIPFEFETDLLKNKDDYLFQVSLQLKLPICQVERETIPTSGAISKQMYSVAKEKISAFD